MTNKELKRLGRRDLLEMLVQLQQQNEALQEKVTVLEDRLNSRTIEMENAGTMAQAAMVLNGVFESADKAAAQYLENIRRGGEQQDRIVFEAEQKAKEILENAEREKQSKMEEADAYWDTLKTRLEEFYRSHPGLKEYLSMRAQQSQSEINEEE